MKVGAKNGSLPQIAGKRFAIVSARFYPELADWLEDGARRGLRDCGVADDAIDRFAVPGCFEIPLACKRLGQSETFDGFVALGTVIRGDTPHFEYVAGECARGIMAVQLDLSLPIGFGILTTDTLAQAKERADPKRGDKGYEAAVAAAAVLALDPSKKPGKLGFR
ncbi:MAG TPA: 6,7-dimethyl-8-ribityllumazine synthase [Candidatus Binatia bacterium]|nr:6,7-dimethyl-8-ribityllumazine synthase [Candidatus Binatia bacterium]